MSWPQLLLLAGGCYAFKFVGLVVVGGRGLSSRIEPIASLIPPALFAALIVVMTLDDDGSLRIDARLAGVVAAAVVTGAAVARRRDVPFVVVVAVGMAVAAGLRALS